MNIISRKLQITANSDRIFLVRAADLVNYFDEHDLACRDSDTILDYYHPNWFDQDDEDGSFFTPPAFYFKNGRVIFINGRHRTLLLIKYLRFLPVLLTKSDAHNLHMISQISEKELDEGFEFHLPALPFHPDWRKDE